jgi:hypothetical protein
MVFCPESGQSIVYQSASISITTQNTINPPLHKRKSGINEELIRDEMQ